MAEVKNMCITEYDEARTLAEEREDGFEEGMKEGMKKGIKQGMELGSLGTLSALVNKGIISISQAAEEAGISVREFQEKTGL